jgi:hypothetical protein
LAQHVGELVVALAAAQAGRLDLERDRAAVGRLAGTGP